MNFQTRPPTTAYVVAISLAWAMLTIHADDLHADCTLPPCTINFDGLCPDAQEMCGASFVGSGGCFFAGKLFCYSSGLRSYLIDPVSPATITFSADLIEVELFFAHVGAAASGEMRFFNAADDEVGVPINTNGDCLAFMPNMQTQVFAEGVRRIEVSASGGRVYIDDFNGTLQTVSGGPPDFDADCDVDSADLAELLAAWGPCPAPCPPSCPADFDADCDVDSADLAELLAAWGSQ